MGSHYIRVIIQGFDRLSGVMRDAASKSAPAIQRVTDKIKDLRRDTKGSNADLKALGTSVRGVGDDSTRSVSRLDRLRNSLGGLRNSLREKFRIKLDFDESPEELFARLRREGNLPLGPRGGQPRRAQFIAAENERRRELQALHEQENALARIARIKRSAFEGFSPLDDIVRGFKKGIDAINQEEADTSIRDQIRIRQQLELNEIRATRDEEKKKLEEILQLRREATQAEFNDTKANLLKENAAERESAVQKIQTEEQVVNSIKEKNKERVSDLQQTVDKEVRADEEASRKRIDRIKAESDATLFRLRRERAEQSKLRKEDGDKAARQAAADERRAALTEEIFAEQRRAKDAVGLEERAFDQIRNSRQQRVKDFESKLQTEVEAEAAASAKRINTIRNDSNEIIRERTNEINRLESASNAAHQRNAQKARADFARETEKMLQEARQRFASEEEDIPNIIKRRNAERVRDVFKDPNLSGLERASARAGAALDDFFRGFKGGRRNLDDFKGAAGRAQTVLAQMGAEFGRATRSINNFVNLRWLLVLGFMASFLTIAVQLGSALVAVASSAAFAAASLGGAFLAGIAQAVPVVGLLAAAMHSLSNAMKVVQLRQQEKNQSTVDATAQDRSRRSAVQALADAHYALKQAIQGVADADYNLKIAHRNVTDAEKEQRDAVKNLADARKEAARAIVDASLEEKDARLGVKEAELGVLDAKQRLLEFERQQRQGAADLQDARAQVREAEERLAIARRQGDAAETSSALGALAIARQNVGAIQDQIQNTSTQQKELEVGVKRAEINAEQARIRRRRAIEDDNKRQRQGVAGSPEVKSAQDQLTQANRNLVDSHRGVAQAERARAEAAHAVLIANRNIRDSELALKDATDKTSASQRNSQREFAKLSPAQQEFVRTMERFQRTYKRFIQPITDVIIGSVNRGLNGAITLMQDPKIRNALLRLARQIAAVGDAFTKWAISPEGRRTIVFFINEATKNLPVIAHAAGQIALAFINIARAASPTFTGIANAIDRVASKFKRWTDDAKKVKPGDIYHHRETEQATSNVDRFFGKAHQHLTAWGRLTVAVGGFFKALIGASAGEGLKMVDGITRGINHLTDLINRNPEKIQAFFERIRHGLGELLPVLGKAALQLVNAFSSDNFIQFTRFMVEVMLPGIAKLTSALGALAGAFSSLVKVPIIGPIVLWVAQAGFAYFAARKLFPVIKALEKPFLSLGGSILGARGRLKAFNDLAKEEGFAKALSAQFPRISRGLSVLAGGFRGVITMIKAVRIALMALLFSPPYWGLIIIGIITAVVLLDRKFHFLKPTIEAIGRALRFVFEWAKDHWKDILAILTGPIGIAVKLIYDHFGSIRSAITNFTGFVERKFKEIGSAIYHGFIDGFTQIGAWFRGIGNWLQNHVLNPIKRFFGISSPSTVMFNIGMQVVNGFVNAFKRLPGLIVGIVKGIPGQIVGLFSGLGKSLFNKISGAVSGAAGAVAGAAKKGGGFLSGVAGAVAGAVTGGAKAAGSAAKTAGSAVKGAGEAILEQESWSNRQQIAQETLTKALPRVYYLNHVIGEMAAVIADKKVKVEKVLQYQGNGAKKLTVVLKDEDDRIVTVRALPNKKPTVAIRQHFAAGGEVKKEGIGEAVDIVAHVGEWVVNKGQQYKLAEKAGTTVGKLRESLFGNKTEQKDHYATGGPVTPGRTKFRDLDRNVQSSRIAHAFLSNRISKEKYEAAMDFWHLRDKSENHLTRAVKWVLFGSKDKPDSGLLGAVHQFAQSVDPRNLPRIARDAIEAFKHPIRRLQQGGVMEFPFGGRIRPILPGSIRYMPATALEYGGVKDRVPAVFLKDRKALIVGRDGFGHGDVESYALKNDPTVDVGRKNAVEVALFEKEHFQAKTPRWVIYGHEHTDPLIARKLQEVKNLPVFVADEFHGTGEQLVASARKTRDTGRPRQLKPIRLGETARVPRNWDKGERGTKGRIPAIYLKDTESFVIGHDGMGHGNVISYIRDSSEGIQYTGRSNMEEVILYPEGNINGIPARWTIFEKSSTLSKHTIDRIADKAQKFSNEPVFVTDYASFQSRQVRERRPGFHVDAKALGRQAGKFNRFVEGKKWSPPPKPRSTGQAVDKEVSTARGNIGEQIVARLTGGRISSGLGQGKGGTGKFDVQLGERIGWEVKTMTVDSRKYQASPRPGEIKSKLDYAQEKGLEPNLAYVIVDPRSNRAHVYTRPGLSTSETSYPRLGERGDKSGWTYHSFVKLGPDQIEPFTRKTQKFAMGGDVSGGMEGKAVPAIVHVGEWVLNKVQQKRLAQKIGKTVEETKMMIFGTKGQSPDAMAKKGRPTKKTKTFEGPHYELTSREDDYGVTVWFLKFGDGQYGQVRAKDADRIIKSHGTWLPAYAKRSTHGLPRVVDDRLRNLVGYAQGGVVSFPSATANSYAAGGVVNNTGPVINSPSGGNTINQNFTVKTEGETDWHHVMRLGALHAQESF